MKPVQTTHEFTRDFTIVIEFQEGDDDAGIGEGFMFTVGSLTDDELYETREDAIEAAEAFINDLDA